MKISATGGITIDGLNSVGVVHTDASGNLSTSLIVNTDIASIASIVDTKLATIVSTGKVANSATTATNSNTPSAIVARDSSGNFSAGIITANLNGNATTATTATSATTSGAATNFNGSLSGDVTGTQNVTVVNSVGGKTAANIAAVTVLVNAATSSNIANTIVKRDGTGSFAAQNISMVNGIVSGFVNIPTTSSLSAGTIQQNGSSFIHSYGTNNTFIGTSSGNFTASGFGNNVGIGENVLSANTIGAFNTVIGAGAGSAITMGSNNVFVGYNVATATTTGDNNIYIDGNNLAPSNENNTIRIGNTQACCFIQGINGAAITGSAVLVSPTGQLGTFLSSKEFKTNIQPITCTENIYSLTPVQFTYKSDITHTLQYGLIAEEVDKIFPHLVIKDTDDRPYTVRYEMLPILLLSELQQQKVIIDNVTMQLKHVMRCIDELNKKIVMLMN